MNKISIVDLEVYYHVGVGDEERARPQRLLLTVEINHDFSAAAMGDRLTRTIDYYEVCQRLLKFGEGRSWKLIEKVAVNVAAMIMGDFKPQGVNVEVKKFIIPQARYVSVTWTEGNGAEFQPARQTRR